VRVYIRVVWHDERPQLASMFVYVEQEVSRVAWVGKELPSDSSAR
jgi:hypothetical protein